MPIYEYQCNVCGHEFERMQKFSDPPITECRICNGEVTKLISQSTFHLKGTGWYVTDYANKSGNGSGGSGQGSKARETKESESKSTGETVSSSSSAKTE